MNRLFAVLSAILAWVFIFALFFVFQGSPDIWDIWHDKALKSLQESKCNQTSKEQQ